MSISINISGLENCKRATKALRDRVEEVADEVERIVTELQAAGETLPGGWTVLEIRSNFGVDRYVSHPEYGIVQHHPYYLHGDFSAQLGDNLDAFVLPEVARDLAVLVRLLSAWIVERTEKMAVANSELTS